MKISVRRPRVWKPEIVGRARREFRGVLEGQGRNLMFAVATSLLATAVELLKPWPIQFVVDHILPSTKVAKMSNWLVWTKQFDVGVQLIGACAAIAILAWLGGQFALTSEIRTAEIGRKVTSRLRRRAFEHIHRLPMEFHFKERSGDLLIRMTADISMVRDVVFSTWMALIGPGLVCLGTMVIMLFVDYRLALLTLLPLPIMIFRVKRSSRRLTALVREQRKKEGEAASLAGESLRQIRTIKTYGAEERMARRFVKDSRSADRANVAATRLAGGQARMSQFLTGIGLGVMIWVGTRLVFSGDLTTGQLLVMISYGRSLYKPMRRVSNEGTKFGKALACTERLLDILARRPEEIGRGERVDRLSGDLVFRNVLFTYGGERPALRDLSLEIPEGALTVISGPNGSGKSTTLNLLLRLFEPSQGTIEIGGRSIGSFELESYRRAIAYVPQDIQLFAGTLKENILFGRPDADDDEVVAAAKAAMAHDFIEKLPSGYDTDIGEAGALLSGGEARRVMLARAALRDGGLLVLDEPFASLDPGSREIVARALRSIAKGRTTIVIHHGETAAISPDLEFRLADGRCAECIRHTVRAGDFA